MVPKPQRTILGKVSSYAEEAAAYMRRRRITRTPFARVHYRGGRSAIAADVYPDLAQFWDDLAAAYAAEIKELHALGCRYLQLDDTSLAYINDPVQREHIKDIGGDPLHQHETYIATINKALAVEQLLWQLRAARKG